MLQVKPISAFKDNYIWLITSDTSEQAFVVDPGDANVVLESLNSLGLSLGGILITHHHWDHTTGVKELKQRFPDALVYGPVNSPFAGISHPLCDGESISLFGTPFKVFATPGHTLDHICYVGDEMMFTGDTLFHGGCGRLFEGTAEQMWQSLNKLAKQKDDILVYCTHEYTESNLRFAQQVEPDNPLVIKTLEDTMQLRSQGKPSLPTTLGAQKQLNPFLRAVVPTILESCPTQYIEGETPAQRFAALRRWKDHS